MTSSPPMRVPSPALASAVYEGVVRHRAATADAGACLFSTAWPQLYLDLDELEQLFEQSLAVVGG